MQTPGNYGRALGYLIAVLGFVVIGLGYNGIAGSLLDTRAQLPYLISGGFLGLAVVIFGVGLIVNSSAREDRSRLEGVMLQLLEAQQASSGTRVPADANGLFAAGAASYHRPDCRLVDGREEVTYVTAGEAASRSLSPCRVCKPEAAAVS
ncbi:MAG: hypothetical protein JWO27_2736 [Frankiales bacterium]|jgi:hypothetical protein|nr:hypothetical protein [Frankiales bacterium]